MSEYEHHSILIFILFDCRNFNTKDDDENRNRRCLKRWLIYSGCLLTVVSLAAMILSIYLLIITINTPTTGTGEGEGLFLKLKVYSYPAPTSGTLELGSTI